MKHKSLVVFAIKFSSLVVTPIALVIGPLVSWKAAAAFAFGDALSIASLYAAQLTVLRIVTPESAKVPVISKLQLLLLIKLPIFAAVVWFVNSLGRVPLFYFLAGYLLVYFGLLVGAIFYRSAPAAYD